MRQLHEKYYEKAIHFGFPFLSKNKSLLRVLQNTLQRSDLHTREVEQTQNTIQRSRI
ncbi:hypothetical protein MTR_6g037730 [Medicago truncatula]|uniref:Uncharacterized protein n=1 Tax=Medicago truncatula TaxID=3880 RepID=A0A072U972_MEDTR|nr:hypothetical protein MTR_6g037730 [Medicago truncatula]